MDRRRLRHYCSAMEKHPNQSITSMLRLRISASDVHYAGDLLSGSKLLEYFGDVATELLIRLDGDEGLFRAYDNVEFLAPVVAGDYLEITGVLETVGNTSRRMSFEAKKVITPEPGASPTAAKVLDQPILVAKATGTCVTPKNLQRKAKPSA